MNETPLSERVRVVLAGPRNAGKSTLMNALFRREVALVSDVPGTTTDPVTRAFELQGLGPVAFTDTPGMDDEGELGTQRVRLAQTRAAEADILLLVTPGNRAPGDGESRLFQEWFGETGGGRKRPAILVLTHAGQERHSVKREWASRVGAVETEAPEGRGLENLLQALIAARPSPEITPLEGLVEKGERVLLVTPIDAAAPVGRLIAPQAQTIRDALDRHAAALVVQEDELAELYFSLPARPKLVVTDSQAFQRVAEILPPDQLLTGFSILFARKKGDMGQFLHGLAAVRRCPEIPKVLILESCSHHRQTDDIGTVKIPRLFRQKVNSRVEFHFMKVLPDAGELRQYHLVIHCGACRLTRQAMGVRLVHLGAAGVPVCNYGMFLAWANGLIPRALEPFKGAMDIWNSLL